MKYAIITLLITTSSMVAMGQSSQGYGSQYYPAQIITSDIPSSDDMTEATLDQHYESQDNSQLIKDERFTRGEIKKSKKEYQQAVLAAKRLQAKNQRLLKAIKKESTQLDKERKKASSEAKALAKAQDRLSNETKKMAKLKEKVSRLQTKRDDLHKKGEDTRTKMVVVNSEVRALGKELVKIQRQLVAQNKMNHKFAVQFKKAVASRAKLKKEIRLRQAKIHIPKPSIARN